jgi:hypothetical protein
MFHTSQWVMSIFEPLLSTGSGSCISRTKLWVPGGTCDQLSAGETALAPAAWVYLSGMTPPSSQAVVVINSGGTCGPRAPPARACPPAGAPAAAPCGACASTSALVQTAAATSSARRDVVGFICLVISHS